MLSLQSPMGQNHPLKQVEAVLLSQRQRHNKQQLLIKTWEPHLRTSSAIITTSICVYASSSSYIALASTRRSTRLSKAAPRYWTPPTTKMLISLSSALQTACHWFAMNSWPNTCLLNAIFLIKKQQLGWFSTWSCGSITANSPKLAFSSLNEPPSLFANED